MGGVKRSSSKYSLIGIDRLSASKIIKCHHDGHNNSTSDCFIWRNTRTNGGNEQRREGDFRRWAVGPAVARMWATNVRNVRKLLAFVKKEFLCLDPRSSCYNESNVTQNNDGQRRSGRVPGVKEMRHNKIGAV